MPLSLSLPSPDHRLFFPALEAVMSLGHPQVQCCPPRLWSALQLSTEEMVVVLQRRSHGMKEFQVLWYFSFSSPYVYNLTIML